jgi:hypothetical protein
LGNKIEDEDEDEDDDKSSSKTPSVGERDFVRTDAGRRDDREERDDLCPDQMRTNRL